MEEKEYKNWEYKDKSPAGGRLYLNKNRPVLMVIYGNQIKIYKGSPNFKKGEMFYPIDAREEMVHYLKNHKNYGRNMGSLLKKS